MTWRPHHTTFFVYLLLDQDDRARYVGLTTQPTRRLWVHRMQSGGHYRGQPAIWRYLKVMRAFGWHRCVDLLLMECVEGVAAARAREAHYIDVYRGLGCQLVNTQGMPKQDQLW